MASAPPQSQVRVEPERCQHEQIDEDEEQCALRMLAASFVVHVSSCATLARRPGRYWLLARNAAIALMSSLDNSSVGMCVVGRRPDGFRSQRSRYSARYFAPTCERSGPIGVPILPT